MPVLDALQAKREPNASSLVFFYKPGKRGEVLGAGRQASTRRPGDHCKHTVVGCGWYPPL